MQNEKKVLILKVNGSKMKNILLVILTLFLFIPWGTTQYRPKTKKKQFYGNPRLHKPLFKWTTGDYSKHGLQVNFGPNYTIPSRKIEDEVLLPNSLNGEDALAKYTLIPEGRLGGFLELGMVHITKRPRKIIHYYDWSIGFKMIGGREYAKTDLYNNRDTLIGSFDGSGEFFNGYLYGRFAVHNVWQINENLFLDNALGFNVDYMAIKGDQSYKGFRPPVPQKFQGDLVAQLNYALGLGFKPNIQKGFFVVPTIEAPFLGAYEWNGGTPQIHWFSSRYYPLTFKVRLIWLFRKDPNACPPVEINSDDRERAREFENRWQIRL